MERAALTAVLPKGPSDQLQVILEFPRRRRARHDDLLSLAGGDKFIDRSVRQPLVQFCEKGGPV